MDKHKIRFGTKWKITNMHRDMDRNHVKEINQVPHIARTVY